MIWVVKLRDPDRPPDADLHYAQVEATDQATAEAEALARMEGDGFTEVVSSDPLAVDGQ